mgnify:CR=1 FL=1
MIEFQNVSKTYKKTTVLSDLNFTIEDGQLVCLIGESGCGKTTTLKMINRLITPTTGNILLNGEDISKKDVIQLRRSIGYVIQQTGLFPHMTVQENIELISKLNQVPMDKIHKKTLEMMEMVGLDAKKYLDRYPTELSGGQQQRIGVARAFMTDPDIILMDEPFSALDPMTRTSLQDELMKLQEQFHKTIVFVTHDMDEAIKIADKICIMDGGHIVQYDTPEQILKHPKNEFVKKFVGPKRIWTNPELIKVKDIMMTRPVVCSKNLSIFKCITRMKMMKVDTLMVVDKDGTYLGSLHASRLNEKSDVHAKVEAYMDQENIRAKEEDSIVDVLKIVDRTHLSTLPVVNEEGKLTGFVTRSSLITSLSQQFLTGGEKE